MPSRSPTRATERDVGATDLPPKRTAVRSSTCPSSAAGKGWPGPRTGAGPPPRLLLAAMGLEQDGGLAVGKSLARRAP